jgi:hypothetical protein
MHKTCTELTWVYFRYTQDDITLSEPAWAAGSTKLNIEALIWAQFAINVQSHV